MRTFSYGGGVQSTAALVLASRGEIDFPIFLMANVGDDSENPATMEYVRDVAMPFAEAHGIDLRLLDRVKRTGEVETLYGRLTKEGSRSIPIPVRMSHNGAPGTRSCTAEFKIRVLAKWHREHGATPQDPAVVGLGISLDEAHRMRSDSLVKNQVLEYPLVDLLLRRHDCRSIIEDAGLDVPPKSCCYFCPFHSMAAWVEQARSEPDLFSRSVELERTLNRRRSKLGKDPVFFTRFGIPLDQIVESYAAQGELFGDYDGPDTCESGYCWT